MGPKKKSLPKIKPPKGWYANYFKVGHNAFEFVFDFGQHYPGSEEAELFLRVITTPEYAKELLKILQESIHNFDKVNDAVNEVKSHR